MATARNPPEESRRDRTTRATDAQYECAPHPSVRGTLIFTCAYYSYVAAHQVLIDVGENGLAHSLDVEARGINGRNAGCGDHEL